MVTTRAHARTIVTEWGVAQLHGQSLRERARALISVVASDADNLYITLSARLLNPNLLIVARAEDEDAESKLRKVGANKVISPYLAGAHRAVQAALRPAVLHFMELAGR